MKRLSFVPLKEVPYEMTFLLKDATQDPTIKNRYWFELPITWLDAEVKDPIIGIRSIYATKTNRFIWYNYHIELIEYESYYQHMDDEDVPLVCVDAWRGELRHWLDGNDTIRVITDYFNAHWFEFGQEWDSAITKFIPEDAHVWEQGEIYCHYEYKGDYHYRGEPYYNRLCLVFGRGFLEDMVYYTDEYEREIPCVYRITLEPINWDTAAVFGLDSLYEIEGWTNVILPTWSRYQCFVKSSLTDMDKNNILGHTRNDPYTPIKYFRYNINVRKFWIELYETRYPDCPVIISKDTLNQNHADDDIIIEAIVCLSSDGML